MKAHVTVRDNNLCLKIPAEELTQVFADVPKCCCAIARLTDHLPGAFESMFQLLDEPLFVDPLTDLQMLDDGSAFFDLRISGLPSILSWLSEIPERVRAFVMRDMPIRAISLPALMHDQIVPSFRIGNHTIKAYSSTYVNGRRVTSGFVSKGDKAIYVTIGDDDSAPVLVGSGKFGDRRVLVLIYGVRDVSKAVSLVKSKFDDVELKELDRDTLQKWLNNGTDSGRRNITNKGSSRAD